jgi:hypothetical protein
MANAETLRTMLLGKVMPTGGRFDNIKHLFEAIDAAGSGSEKKNGLIELDEWHRKTRALGLAWAATDEAFFAVAREDQKIDYAEFANYLTKGYSLEYCKYLGVQEAHDNACGRDQVRAFGLYRGEDTGVGNWSHEEITRLHATMQEVQPDMILNNVEWHVVGETMGRSPDECRRAVTLVAHWDRSHPDGTLVGTPDYVSGDARAGQAGAEVIVAKHLQKGPGHDAGGGE